MCDKNIAAKAYKHGGTIVATTTTSIEKMANTAQEMAEAQRDSYEALAENFRGGPAARCEACRGWAGVREAPGG